MKKITVSIFIILLLASSAQAQFLWNWSHPKPQGNTLRYVKAISATDWVGVGYAGTFIKTTNAGVNWYTTVNAAGIKTTAQTFFYSGWFFDATTGLACGGSGQIFRTSTGGLTWDSIPSGVTATLYGMHFINSTTGFIGGTSGTVLKTTNGGLNWSAIAVGNTLSIYNIYALDANHIYAPTSTTGIILITTNGGTNWAIDTTGTSVTLYDACFKDTAFGLVCGTASTLRYTTNGGANWTAGGTGLPSSTFYDINYNGGNFYVSGNSFYIFRSTNNCSSWDSIMFNASGQTYTSTQYSFDKVGTTMIIGGAFGLLNYSTNTGTLWNYTNPLIYSSSLEGIWCDNMTGKVIAVGLVAPSPVMLSTNGGTNWTTVATNITYGMYGIKMLNSNTGYACGASGKVIKTTNGGANWDSVSFVGAANTLYSLDFISVDTGFCSGATGSLYKTVNGGLNWTSLATGSTSTLYHVDMADANTGWFCGSTGAIYKTIDGGANWTAQTGNYTSTLYWVQMFNANSGYLCGLSGTLRRTTNGGTNWDTVLTPYTATQYSCYFTDMNTGFISGSAGYTIRTSNGGANWQVTNNGGATLYSIYAKGYDSAWVCGSGANIFKLYNFIIGGVNWSNTVPERYTLSQNFPNPFNPVTKISFGLPKLSKVSLKVYDIIGREVAVLFNNQEINKGTVTLDFDGSELASGVYFYSLIINDNLIDTKKMVLIK